VPLLDSLRAWVSLPGLVNTLILELRKVAPLMADVSPILTKLAEDLRAYGAGPLAALIAENVALKGEDAGESTAAQGAVDAFNAMVAPVTQSPDVPVEIPPVEAPANAGTDPGATA
jgi:hypothetical protein